MNLVSIATVLILSLLTVSTSFANDAILRVSCQQQDAGTKIYINNIFKGECPVDIMVPAGTLTLRAHKIVDAENEQSYSEQLDIVAGVAKRIDIRLSQPQLTPVAQKARDFKKQQQQEKADLEERQRKEKVAKEAKQRAEEAAKKDLLAAQGGDIQAMAVMAERFETGDGVSKDVVQATIWKKKATDAQNAVDANKELQSAKAGNIDAMEGIALRYETGKGIKKDAIEATSWQLKAKAARDSVKQQKLAKEKLDTAAQQQAKLAKAKKNFSYTKQTDSFLKDGMKFGNDPFEGLFKTTLSPVMTVVMLTLDIVSTPTRITEWKKISKDITGHASSWAKPDSMMAKAYRQQQVNGAQESRLILAAR